MVRHLSPTKTIQRMFKDQVLLVRQNMLFSHLLLITFTSIVLKVLESHSHSEYRKYPFYYYLW